MGNYPRIGGGDTCMIMYVVLEMTKVIQSNASRFLKDVQLFSAHDHDRKHPALDDCRSDENASKDSDAAVLMFSLTGIHFHELSTGLRSV